MSKRPSIKDYTWNEIYSKTDSEGKHSIVVLGREVFDKLKAT